MFFQPPLFPLPDSVERELEKVRASVKSQSNLSLNDRAARRFWNTVVKGPGSSCWIWCGAVSSPDGYGRFTWQHGSVRRTLSAHRVALLLERGELPNDMVGEHCCCEPLCVRVDPQHLRVTSQSANIAHAVRLGRHAGGRPVVDSADRYARSLRVRAAVSAGWDEAALRSAQGGNPGVDDHPQLW
jgi:hypothetical protein